MKQFLAFLLFYCLLLTPLCAGDLVRETLLDNACKQYPLNCVALSVKGRTYLIATLALAREMKQIIREKIQEGASDQAILDFFQTRYGDFVLLRPGFNLRYLLLWLSPFVIAIGTILLFYFKIKNQSKTYSQPESQTLDTQTILQELSREDHP